MSEKQTKKIIVTSALPYVNNSIHLGNLIGSVLSADVFVRYLRTFRPDVEALFVGGVDEYGTATEVKARELGITCKELCDINEKKQRDIYEWFKISFDCYGRTSQPNGDPSKVQEEWPHTKITHDIFQKLCENDYVIEQKEQVMFCPDLNCFVADRFVVGTCPNCAHTKADGDQCENCGKLHSPNELINPKYKPDSSLSLELKETTNLYIDTNRIWTEFNMSDWFKSRKSWTKSAVSITNEWVNSGLQSRSITRDLKWGTSVPDTSKFGSQYSNKVFYVWFDAPIGYISISENSLGESESNRFWKDPETKLIQFMAKDNVPFHSVIFPVTLRGSNYSITDVDIVSTEYLMYEGTKFSKSKNQGLFCDEVVSLSDKLNIPPDYWRAYLISIRPETSDSNFVLNETGFVDFVNNILIKNFGNLTHRILSMAYQMHEKNMKSTDNTLIYNDIYDKTSHELDAISESYCSHMSRYELSESFRLAMRYSSRLNLVVNDLEPWKLIKNNDCDSMYDFMVFMFKHIKTLLKMLSPIMPTICEKLDKHFEFQNDSIVLPQTKPSVLINQLTKISI